MEPLEDFGQTVDLAARLREILSNYPEGEFCMVKLLCQSDRMLIYPPSGTSILKELIQNADDAGATTISFILDKR